jgi:hypothetical protein
MRHVKIIYRRWLRQKWYAQFIADNGEPLSVTEHYHNLNDLLEMLDRYFPSWQIEGTL